MKPVRTAEANLVYTGPPGVGDLHCIRWQPGMVSSVWTLTPVERAAIAADGNILLTVWTEPHPPVAVEVTEAQGVGEDAPDIQARLETLNREPPPTNFARLTRSTRRWFRARDAAVTKLARWLDSMALLRKWRRQTKGEKW